MPDDYPASTATPRTIAVNGSATARIDSGLTGDQDWFRVALTAGTRYRIDAEGRTPGTDAHIGGIHDSAGTLIPGTTNDNGGIARDARVWFTAPATGDYYVSAGAAPGRTYAADMQYVVRVQDDWDIGPGDTSTPFTLKLGGNLVAEIDEGSDTDWYRLVLDAGQTVAINASGAESTYYANRFVFTTDVRIGGVYDATGTLIPGTTVANPGDLVERLQFTAPVAGTYYVEIAGEGSAPEGVYRVAAYADDLAAGPDTTGITSGTPDRQTRQSDLFKGDEDWIVVPLQEGDTYEFFSSNKTRIKLYDPDGNPVPGAEASGFEGLLFTAPEGGSYFAAITGRTDTVSGRYTLEVLRDRASGDTATDAAIAPGGSASVRLHPGDTDWLRVDLTEGTAYHFILTENPFTFFGGTITGIHDSAGTPIPGAASGGAPSVTYTPATSGPYFVSLAARDGTRAGDVFLRVIGDDYDASPATTGTLAIGGSATGEIPFDGIDRDWFAVTLEAGETYRFTMAGSGTNPLWYEQLSVFDAAGHATGASATGTYRGIAALSFTAPASGTWYIEASSARSGSSAWAYGTYTVDARQLVPLLGTAADDWLTLPATGAADLVRIDGLAGEDMLSFAGFDRGVTLDLQAGSVRRGTLALPMEGIEHVTGTSYADRFIGGTEGARMRGLGGPDWFYSGAGADTIDGGAGPDRVSYRDAGAGVSASLLRGRGWGGDALGDRYTDIEELSGSDHDDFLWGDHGDNWLTGGPGDDTLVGNGGDDYIVAGAGIDVIVFSGNRADYTIVRSGIGTDVTDRVGGDGHDVLLYAEILRFADGDVIL